MPCSSFKLQSGVPLKNSHKWLCDFFSFHHFLYVCKNCTGISPSYNDVACSPVCVTTDQTDISSTDMLTSGYGVNVSDVLETDIKPQLSDFFATRQVNQCLEDIVSKFDTISHELDKLKDKLVSFPNQKTTQSDCYGSNNHSKLKKWSKPNVKIYRSISMTFFRSDHKSKTSIAPKATGIKTRSRQPSQPVSQYSDVMVAALFKHIQPAVGNKPQLDKSGDTTLSRTSDLRVDSLTIVNNAIISSLADHHPISATVMVFTPPASSPSAN